MIEMMVPARATKFLYDTLMVDTTPEFTANLNHLLHSYLYTFKGLNCNTSTGQLRKGADPITTRDTTSHILTMASMNSEPANSRSRRQAFIAKCSPDELLGQVIQTLCPRYNIDAPHMLALRQLLGSKIVAPRSPPTLKRTRPDKRIGEIGSIYDTPRRSPFGPNGPPVSADQSFYFHHQDEDFERLLPRVDRSHYVWRDEPESQSDSDSSEEALNSQEGSQSQVSRSETLASERKERTPLTTSVAPASTASDERTAAKAYSEAQESQAQQSPHWQGTHGPTSNDEKPSIPESGPATPRKAAPANSSVPQQPSIPSIFVITPRSTERIVTSKCQTTALSSPLLPAANVTIDQPDSQEMYSVPPPPYSASPLYMNPGPDTQDTVNSTQQSEVFSPPNEFVQFTPPSQEQTQQGGLSQAETFNSYPHIATVKPTMDPPKSPPRRSPRVFASSPPIATPSLSKRSREKSESPDAAPPLKRSKAKK
ncbi:hypothetical protein E8E11_005332 [Didymella keratinophila]|nr:hypothetical protein E8E11_005332 [Didymella keratinophila]